MARATDVDDRLAADRADRDVPERDARSAPSKMTRRPASPRPDDSERLPGSPADHELAVEARAQDDRPARAAERVRRAVELGPLPTVILVDRLPACVAAAPSETPRSATKSAVTSASRAACRAPPADPIATGLLRRLAAARRALRLRDRLLARALCSRAEPEDAPAERDAAAANHAQPSATPAITSESQWTSSRTRLPATATVIATAPPARSAR